MFPEKKNENYPKSTAGDKAAFNHRNQHCGHSCDPDKYFDTDEAVSRMIAIRNQLIEKNKNFQLN